MKRNFCPFPRSNFNKIWGGGTWGYSFSKFWTGNLTVFIYDLRAVAMAFLISLVMLTVVISSENYAMLFTRQCYANLCTYMYMRAHTHMRAWAHTHTHTHILTHTHTNTHTNKYTLTKTYTHCHIHICTHTYTRAHTHTHTSVRAHTHTSQLEALSFD